MFEFLFNYSPEIYEEGEFIFANTWPAWSAVAVFILLSFVISYYLLRNRRLFTSLQLGFLGLLQLLMLVLVLAIIWQPSLLIERLRTGDNVIAMMLDTSTSMAYDDNDVTRIDQARNVLTDDAMINLQNDYPFRYYIFADDATDLESYVDLPPPVPRTNIADSVLKVLRQASTTSLGAIILMSDGADNAGSLDNSQLAEIAGFGVPVHTIGIGRETIPEDVELTEVVLPEKALPNSTLSARVTLRHDAGGEVRVKVYDGDDYIGDKQVQLDRNEATTTAWLDFNIEGTGHRDLHFSVDPIQNEKNLENNTVSRVIDIPEDNYRILYVEGEPRWEYKFMRRALEDDSSIHLVTVLRVSPNKFYRQGINDPEELELGFPQTREELFGYHALIIGSFEAPLISPEQQQLIHDFVSERGGSLLMIAGLNGLGNGSWGNTVVGKILPAQIPEDGTRFERKRAAVNLTPAGRRSPMLKFADDSEQNENMWRELPEIADYQVLGSLRPAALTLLTIEAAGREQPLFVTQPFGRGHTYILATGGTWRWQMSLPVEDQRHETFWRQVIRGMVASTPRHIELSGKVINNRLSVRADVRDDQFKPQQDISVTAVVTQPSGDSLTLELTPSAGEAGVFEGEYFPDEAGLISIEAISRQGDEPIDTARMSIYNESENAEFFSLRQNRGLLERLADVTGGSYWNAGQLSSLPDAIQLSRAGITEQDIRPLWDAPLLFLILIFLKSLEWLTRRHWRTI